MKRLLFFAGQHLLPNLQSALGQNPGCFFMNITVVKTQCCIAIVAFLLLFSTPLAAVDVENLDWTGAREKWGQVIFCQRIYKMPEVQSRLYSFDIEQCNSAGQSMRNVVARYSESQQLQLKNQAEQHAVALGYNTQEPYHSVAACREFCSEMAETQDKNDEQ